MSVRAKLLGYVFLGGALGTMLRYLIFEAMANWNQPEYELAALFTVNLAGSFFLGLAARHPYFQTEVCRNLWGVGFAGAFTTMSAVTMLLDYQGYNWEIVQMLVLGLASYASGFHTGRRIARLKA